MGLRVPAQPVTLCLLGCGMGYPPQSLAEKCVAVGVAERSASITLTGCVHVQAMVSSFGRSLLFHPAFNDLLNRLEKRPVIHAFGLDGILVGHGLLQSAADREHPL